MVETFANHPEIDMFYGDVNIIDSAGSVLYISASDPLSLEAAVAGDFTVMQQSAWRRRVTEQIGDFVEDSHFALDGEYWMRMKLAGFRLEYIPGIRAEFRMHDASKTISLRRRFIDDWKKVLDRLYADPTLPEHVRRYRPMAQEFLEWQYAKVDYSLRDYDSARPSSGESSAANAGRGVA
ncbi:MAG: hypothetical protein IPK19_10300 [Chloroflexi bacterium]|nr:hypothetical protein [Chloroflexota bacterium]